MKSRKSRTPFYLLIIPLLALLYPIAPDAQAQSSASYKAATNRWRAADGRFSSWLRAGVTLTSSGTLQLDPQKARSASDPYGPGKYMGGNFYNGGSFLVGEAMGPIVTPSFAFSEAVPSWNADTPTGSWIEVQLRARMGTRWTRWYNMGVWANNQEVIKSHSVSGQADADGYVDVDTLKLGKRGKPLTATSYQMKVRLFSTAREILPSVQSAAVVVSTKPAAPAKFVSGDATLRGKLLDVPECSQMVYPDGGEVWCSPTSVAMVLGFWAGRTGPCEPDVRAAVSGVYDRTYKGHGNWPFNAAYAAGEGMESYITRFTSMSKAEKWIAAGVPVIMSVGWSNKQLAGAPLPSSSGHLMVLVGFDAKGNPVMNDPAASSNEAVQRTYLRSELERLWVQSSGGIAYLIYPVGKLVPKP